MKKGLFKKYAAITMAATMLLANATTAFASQGGGNGTGTNEGYVQEKSQLLADVPTGVNFDFIADPNGLIAKTDGAAHSGVSFDGNVTDKVYFKTVSGSDVTYKSQSDAVKITNYSSFDVTVEVVATVSSNATAKKVAIANSAITSSSSVSGPTLYIGVVNGTTKVAASVSGAATTNKLSGNIAGVSSNYDTIVSTNGQYVYAVSGGDVTALTWNDYEFHLEGAVAGDWKTDQNGFAASLNVVWKLTDPSATIQKTVAYAANTDLTVTVSELGSGLTLSTITYNGATGNGITYNSTTKVLTLAKSAASYVKNNASVPNTWTLTFSDGSVVELTMTR